MGLIRVAPVIEPKAVEPPIADAFRDRRIAIFEPYADFATNPTLVGLSEALSGAGALVDILMPRSDRFPSGDGLGTQHRFPYRTPLWRGDVRKTLRGWGRGLRELPFRHQVEQMFAGGSFDLIVGVDSDGIIEGQSYAERFGMPLAYLSFEIFFWDELTSSYERRRKAQECERQSSSRSGDHPGRAACTAVGGRERPRAGEIRPSAGLPHGRCVRRRFGLPAKEIRHPRGQTIVLHSGGFGDETYAEELLESAAAWPADFVLVIHTKYRPGEATGMSTWFEKQDSRT